MPRILVLALLLALMPIAPVAAACSAPVCVYLPMVGRPVNATPTAIVLPTHSAFTIDGDRFLRIVGEVQNTTSSTLQSIRVSVRLFNGQQLVETGSSPIPLHALRAGDKTCFNIIMGNPAAWTSYRFDAVDSEPATTPMPGLTFFNVIDSVDQIGAYRIIGQVQNELATTAHNAEAIGTLYDAIGTVLDCNFTSVNSTDLAPDQISSFGILFFDRRPYTGVGTSRIQVTSDLP